MIRWRASRGEGGFLQEAQLQKDEFQYIPLVFTIFLKLCLLYL